MSTATPTKPRVQAIYEETVQPALMKEFGYTNRLQVPRLVKIIVNMGVGEAVDNPKEVEEAAGDLGIITGQKPLITRSKKAISNFRLRGDYAIGCKVTLRGRQMYEFFDRFVGVSLPRVRDFRGISPKSFDGRGNYSVGLQDQLIFPEIDLDKIKRPQGMDITVVTSAKTDKEAKGLLTALGMPFRKD